MSGSLPHGQPAYNGQHLMGYSLNGSLNGPMNGAMNGAMNGSMNGTMNGTMNGSINGSINGLNGISPLGNQMSPTMGGMGNPLALNNGGMGMGSINGMNAGINAGMGSMNGLGLGAGQYQQSPARPPLPSPQLYQQPAFQSQFTSPNLLNTQLNSQLPHPPHQHPQPQPLHHQQHQPHQPQQHHHQQHQHQQHHPSHQPLHQLPQPQRYASPQQGHVPFPMQRVHSNSSSNGGVGNFSSFQPPAAQQHIALPHTSPSLASMTSPMSMPMPMPRAGATPTAAPMHSPSPTVNHLASPMQFIPQQQQAHQQPQQSHQQHRHHQQPQQQQQQLSPRYSQPPTMNSQQMNISMFTNASPVAQPQRLPKQQQQQQPQQQQEQQQPPHHQPHEPIPQPLSQTLNHQPLPRQMSQPLSQSLSQSSLPQYSPQAQQMQLHQEQPMPDALQQHYQQQQQQQQQQQPYQQASPHGSFASPQTPQHQAPAKPIKPPRPQKPKLAQQAKKPISLPVAQSPTFVHTQLPANNAPPPPPLPASMPSKKHQAPSVTPSPIPRSISLPTDSPRASLTGGIQKPGVSASAAVKAARKSSVGGGGSGASPVLQVNHHLHGQPRRTAAETASLLVCIADDCFERAQAMGPVLARTRDGAGLREYYKLLATGLGSLETAMRTHRFAPRVEVKIKIRYASILSSETENLMEAETTLQSAIATCEKHRLADLKIYVQFLFMKVLFRRKPKAALISIQNHINDCTDRRHTYWTYAFRFLKALFYLESGNPAEPHALDNLHAITTLAEQRGDHAVFVLASLLQGLALFRTTEADVVERVQTCMAAASKYQLDETVHIPQLDVLWLLLDLGCSVYHKDKAVADKLSALQGRLEELKESGDWGRGGDNALGGRVMLLPLSRDVTNSNGHTISADTEDVLQPGEECDYLVLNTFSKVTAFVLGFAYSGLTLAPKQQMNDRRCMDFWTESLRMIAESSDSAMPSFLHEAMDESRWRAGTAAYVIVLKGLNAATRCEWATVSECIQQLEAPVAEARDGPLDVLALYLRGVLKQGQGELNDALAIFEDSRLALSSSDLELSSAAANFGGGSGGGSGPASAAAAAAAAWSASNNEGHMRQEVTLLAAMNRLMIMQLIRLRDEPKINLLVDELQAVCAAHANPEIRTAYSLVMAAITTAPALSMQEVKRYIQQGLTGSTVSSNAQCLNIALNTMRYRLFENVVGEQALKSAKAGSAQAKKSGNVLWMSVADGMLAETYEVAGKTAQAQAARQAGVQYANESWQRTQL